MRVIKGELYEGEILTVKQRSQKARNKGKNYRPSKLETHGAHLRAWVDSVLVDHIPAGCWCTWNPNTYDQRNPQWRLKFRHTSCPLGKGHG